MNQLKRALGMIWIAFAIAAAYFCIFEFGLPKFVSGKQEDLVFGIIILCVLTPLIVIGLGTFGYYSLLGEYDKPVHKHK
jgi:membrane protease YdiL (CAAX protease family)